MHQTIYIDIDVLVSFYVLSNLYYVNQSYLLHFNCNR